MSKSAKDRLSSLPLEDLSYDYLMSAFDGEWIFTQDDIKRAWMDGVKWGHNFAFSPKPANVEGGDA